MDGSHHLNCFTDTSVENMWGPEFPLSLPVIRSTLPRGVSVGFMRNLAFYTHLAITRQHPPLLLLEWCQKAS